MKFLDVRTDFAFKKVFGSEESKDILLSFLNAMIRFDDGSTITDLAIVDPYQIPLLKGMKETYVDVKAVLSSGQKVIIEMQVLNVEGFEKRVLYNAAKAYAVQLDSGLPYPMLEPVIALTITDFKMFPDFEKVISYFRLLEKETLIEYNGDIELIFIELPKFDKGEADLATIVDKWIFFVKNAGSLAYIPQALAAEPSIERAFQMANTAGLTPDEYDMQIKRTMYLYDQQALRQRLHEAEAKAQEAKQEAQEAKQEAQEEKNMRLMQLQKTIGQLQARGFDPGAIAEIVGLAAAEVEIQ